PPRSAPGRAREARRAAPDYERKRECGGREAPLPGPDMRNTEGRTGFRAFALSPERQSGGLDTVPIRNQFQPERKTDDVEPLRQPQPRPATAAPGPTAPGGTVRPAAAGDRTQGEKGRIQAR